MEKKDVVTCPECSVENPKSRATCLVCHTPLYKMKETTKGKKVEGTIEPKKAEGKVKVESRMPPPTTPPPPPTKLTPDSFTSKQSPKEPIASPLNTDPVVESKSRKRRVEIQKRKPRRKSHIVLESQYFILQGQNLMPVEITQHVKALKRAMVKDEAGMLVDLWNRNKSLLQK